MGLLAELARAITPPRPHADVTVIIPTIPGREELLDRAAVSAMMQTVQVDVVAIVDTDRRGPAVLRNEMIAASRAEWVAFLDDDDYLDPHHIETLLAHSDDADVVVPYCRFDGPPLPVGYYNRQFDARVLRRHGIFPITVLARREAIIAAGCFRPEDRYEDWSLWNRMVRLGARFVVVPEVTWTYDRSGHANRTDGSL